MPLDAVSLAAAASLGKGALDAFPGLFDAAGACKLVGRYNGPLLEVQRDHDGLTMPVYPAFPSIWPDLAALRDFAEGAPLYISALYLQWTGRKVSMAALTRPLLDISTDRPWIDFDGYNNVVDLTGTFADFGRGLRGVTIAAVRRNEQALNNGVNRPWFFASKSDATNFAGVRFSVGTVAAGTEQAIGRRNDTAASVSTAGFPLNRQWDVHLAAFDFLNAQIRHRLGGQAQTAAFDAPGTMVDTPAQLVRLGRGASGGAGVWRGRMTAFVAWNRAFPDSVLQRIAAALRPLAAETERPGQILNWGDRPQANLGLGITLPLVPGVVSTSLLAPSGATPTQADLASHRYHHHSCGTSFGGRQWAAFSSGLNTEDTTGQCAIIFSSVGGTGPWGAPALAVPPQQAMGDGSGQSTDRPVQPLAFLKTAGRCFLASTVQIAANADWAAILATEVFADGTVGTPFRISTAAYVPPTGPTPAYDGTLGPVLMGLLRNAHSIGIDNPATQPGKELVGAVANPTGGTGWTEQVVFQLDGTGQKLGRLMRKHLPGKVQNQDVSSRNFFWWAQSSENGGLDWTDPVLTPIQNSPSRGWALRLPDGRNVFVWNMAGQRDPLCLAIFDTAGACRCLYAVRQGLPPNPVYPGAGKNGGPQYPCVWLDGTDLWISYSIAKEECAITRIPLAGIVDN